ncbi:MAG: hypothetical protein Q7T48_21835 [Cellvibrio sp.]|nr:hypothetical protein [Cellvibrio sp.]
MSQHPEERSKKNDTKSGGKNDSGKLNDVKSGQGGAKGKSTKK